MAMKGITMWGIMLMVGIILIIILVVGVSTAYAGESPLGAILNGIRNAVGSIWN